MSLSPKDSYMVADASRLTLKRARSPLKLAQTTKALPGNNEADHTGERRKSDSSGHKGGASPSTPHMITPKDLPATGSLVPVIGHLCTGLSSPSLEIEWMLALLFIDERAEGVRESSPIY